MEIPSPTISITGLVDAYHESDLGAIIAKIGGAK